MIECTDEYLLKKNVKRKKRKNRFIRIIIFISVFSLFFAFEKHVVSKNVFNICSDTINAIALEEINDAVSISLENDFNYENVIKIEKNNLGDIVLISADNVKINTISRNIINLTKIGITNSIKGGIPVPWLSFLGIGLLSGYGKSVYIKTVNVVSVDCEFVSNFESKGINQTLHSIYVNVSSTISVDIPLNNKKVSATSTVLLCESVLLGKVPDYYLGKNVLG